MPARFAKKVRKMRGSQTHGWGMRKKHRGSGSRGGHGQGGLLYNKKSWMLKYDPEHFGKHGFKPLPRKEMRAITLKDIDALADNLNRNEINLSEFGFQKVLSTGRLTKPLTIKAQKFVEKAKQKIEESGGKYVEG